MLTARSTTELINNSKLQEREAYSRSSKNKRKSNFFWKYTKEMLWFFLVGKNLFRSVWDGYQTLVKNEFCSGYVQTYSSMWYLPQTAYGIVTFAEHLHRGIMEHKVRLPSCWDHCPLCWPILSLALFWSPMAWTYLLSLVLDCAETF